MSLQVEDIYDVLSIKFPQYNFLLLLDQSSGHGRMGEGGLNINTMSVRWGGKQDKMRSTKIKEVGPYHRILEVGDEQSMVFIGVDDGPFYLLNNHRVHRKFDRKTGKR